MAASGDRDSVGAVRAGDGTPAAGDPFVAAPPLLRELLALATELAREAALLHHEGRHGTLRIATKSSATDLVSHIDEEAERLIVARLSEARPGDGVFAEEGALRDGDSGVRWLIDPLDGTTNYVYGYPAFAVSIGIEVDGEPAVGVVLDSSRGHEYRAVHDCGAVCDDCPIRARDEADLATALVATGFSYAADQRRQQGAAVTHVLGRVRDIRRAGSAALDLCRVAAGQVNAFWELDLSPWDYAAGTVIAREAGAEVRFPAAAHGRGPAVVAAHPALMPAFVELLREAGALA